MVQGEERVMELRGTRVDDATAMDAEEDLRRMIDSLSTRS